MQPTNTVSAKLRFEHSIRLSYAIFAECAFSLRRKLSNWPCYVTCITHDINHSFSPNLSKRARLLGAKPLQPPRHSPPELDLQSAPVARHDDNNSVALLVLFMFVVAIVDSCTDDDEQTKRKAENVYTSSESSV